MKLSTSVALFLLLLATAAPLAAQEQAEKKAADETSSMIPEVGKFHEVIYVLWHKGYPEKDYALIRSKNPEVTKFAEELPGYPLPGILRDKKDKWEHAVQLFVTSATAFSDAVMKNETEKLLEATETLHANYEGLVRTMRPVMKELDAYHVVLYKIFHKYLPGAQWDDLREASIQLSEKCGALAKAAVPAKLKEKAAQFEKNRKALCDATDNLSALAKRKGEKAIEKAVNDVHAKYRILEKMFD